MRHLPIAVMTSLALFVAACDGSDGGASPGAGGVDGSSGGEASTGDAGDTSTGPGTGGSVGSTQVEFTDLPGKIRFINFVSDGTAGVNLDLYWGTSIRRGEKVATVQYGEITEFLTPRHAVADEPLLGPDEGRFFMLAEGDVSATPSSFLVLDDEVFTADTVLTLGLAAAENLSGDALAVAVQTFDEAKLSPPPTGMAHVFGWASAFRQIEGGDFVLVGADGLCNPDRGESGGANLGASALIPEGTTGLSLFDANTEPPCATGAPPVTGSVEAGKSYVLLGEAETYEIEARRVVLLELGTEN